MDFKDRIRTRRLELGLTTDEVAKIVGVSNGTISRWETGDIKNQRRDKIALLAKALQTTPAALLGYSDIGSLPSTPSPLSEEAERIGRAFDAAGPREKDIVRLTLAPFIQAASSSSRSLG